MGNYYDSKFAELSAGEVDQEFLRKLSMYKDYVHRHYQNLDGCDHWKAVSYTHLTLPTTPYV